MFAKIFWWHLRPEMDVNCFIFGKGHIPVSCRFDVALRLRINCQGLALRQNLGSTRGELGQLAGCTRAFQGWEAA